jgi:hypothetical protein
MVNLDLRATVDNVSELTIRPSIPVFGNRSLSLVAAFLQQVHSGMITGPRAAWNRDRFLDYLWIK